MDSDSDSSLAIRKRPGSTTILDDDSSDDDSLLGSATTFRSSKRKKKINKVDSILGDALKKASQNLEDKNLMQRMKREDLDIENLVNSAKRMKNEAENKKSTSINKPKTEQAIQRETALVEVADTQLTLSAGSRKTIYSCKLGALPSSTQMALAYLRNIINEKSKVSQVVQRVLLKNLEQGSLPSFLSTGRLLTSQFHKKHTKILPFGIVRWMFEVACSTGNPKELATKGKKERPYETLARGAYFTLSLLWKDHHGFCDNGMLLATQDIPEQLEQWFGVKRSMPLSSKEDPTESQTSTVGKNPSTLALTRYLHLWEIAFSQGMVHTNDLESISRCILTLVLVALDPIFETSNTNANQALMHLHKLLNHLLDAAIESHQGNELCKEWLQDLVEGIYTLVTKLGPGLPGAIDADDSKAWISQARLIGILSGASYESTRAVQRSRIAMLVTELCNRVIQACSKLSSEALKAKVTSILIGKWQLSEESAMCSRWTATATSLIALSLLKQNISIEGEEALCAAICEISFLCFQNAITLFKDVNNSSDVGDESAIRYTAYDAIESELSAIATKSNTLVLSNPYYLRVNYFANCFRQYPRLEKLHFQARQTVESQATLDSYFAKEKET